MQVYKLDAKVERHSAFNPRQKTIRLLQLRLKIHSAIFLHYIVKSNYTVEEIASILLDSASDHLLHQLLFLLQPFLLLIVANSLGGKTQLLVVNLHSLREIRYKFILVFCLLASFPFSFLLGANIVCTYLFVSRRQLDSLHFLRLELLLDFDSGQLRLGGLRMRKLAIFLWNIGHGRYVNDHGTIIKHQFLFLYLT